jgi:hypothetical protein
MKRVMVLAVFLAGLVTGLWMARSKETTVLAQIQSAWECKSFNMDLNQDTSGAIGGFLRDAGSVQLTSAGLSAGQRFAVVACKR